MHKGEVLIHIRIADIHSVDICFKILIKIPVSSVILHGNSHDKKLFIRFLRLIALNNFLIHFRIGYIFTHQIALVKALQKIHFIKAKFGIYDISAPSRVIIRMHRHAGIVSVFQRIHDGICIFFLNVLLIYHRPFRKICHTAACQKLPFRIWRFRSVDRSKRIAPDGIFFQRIDKRHNRLIGFQIAQDAQIRK